MTKLLIVDAFTLLIREKNVANYALLRCKTLNLKIWLCKILDNYHVCAALGATFASDDRIVYVNHIPANNLHRQARQAGPPQGFRRLIALLSPSQS